MSWIKENHLTWYERLALNVVKSGPIPYHVAFIMDGNRRFATKANIKKAEGHYMGFDKLSTVLQWCLSLGITEVTVYAFSIENFNRSEDEVQTLMQLAKEKFDRLIQEEEKLNENGVKINIIGNTSLLPQDIQQSIAKAMLITKDNSKCQLNVAFSYTSREEITHSIKTIVAGVESNELCPADVNEDLLTQCLYTKCSREPDLLVRTSGETRLSDFLLWQTTSSVIYFTDTLWPEFTLWNLLGAVLLFQRKAVRLKLVKQILESNKEIPKDPHKICKFLEKTEEKQHLKLKTLADLEII